MANLVATSTGYVTLPSQSSFLAVSGTSAIANITGDGTVYTIDFAGSTKFDQNSNFSSNTTFTAPITGRYHFSAEGTITNVTTGMIEGYSIFVTSNRSYYVRILNAIGNVQSNDHYIAFPFSVFTDMDVADTAVVKLVVSGSTKTVSLASSATIIYSVFSGNLRY
jgi:hypothetical protein